MMRRVSAVSPSTTMVADERQNLALSTIADPHLSGMVHKASSIGTARLEIRCLGPDRRAVVLAPLNVIAPTARYRVFQSLSTVQCTKTRQPKQYGPRFKV